MIGSRLHRKRPCHYMDLWLFLSYHKCNYIMNSQHRRACFSVQNLWTTKSSSTKCDKHAMLGFWSYYIITFKSKCVISIVLFAPLFCRSWILIILTQKTDSHLWNIKFYEQMFAKSLTNECSGDILYT